MTAKPPPPLAAPTGATGVTARADSRSIFARTTWYVAATAALFAFGARFARGLVGAAGAVEFIAVSTCLLGMSFVSARSG